MLLLINNAVKINKEKTETFKKLRLVYLEINVVFNIFFLWIY